MLEWLLLNFWKLFGNRWYRQIYQPVFYVTMKRISVKVTRKAIKEKLCD